MTTLSRASVLCELGRYDEALPVVQRWLADHPDDDRGYCLLAFVLDNLGRHSEAVNAAERAIVLDPDNDAAHRLRAWALLSLKKRRAALTSAQAAVRLAPDVAENHYCLMSAELALRHVAKAGKSAQRCAEAAPDTTLGHNAIGQVALRKRDWSGAEAACRRALAIEPDNVVARHNLGLALSRQRGRALEGIDHLAEASKLNPRSRLSRDQAVVAGRRYAGLGAFGAYLFFSMFRQVTPWRDSARFNDAVLALFIVGAVVWAVRRRRRVARLPKGVGALVHAHERSVSPGFARIASPLAITFAIVGLLTAASEPRAGVVVFVFGVGLWFLVRKTRRPASSTT
jgi:tetratricopeptide (TPR) repeat protein